MKFLLKIIIFFFIIAFSVVIAYKKNYISAAYPFVILPSPSPLPSPIPTPTIVPSPTPQPLLPVTKKPAIYLYPTSFIPVSVKLNIRGTLTKSIPSYPKNGWYVIATPNSLIDNRYDYLFYEAKLDKYEVGEDGWVVATKDLKSWFSKYLPMFGLNKKEISQFKSYWLKELTLPGFYEIKLLSEDFLGENMDITINPTPDTIIRVEFYFKHLDNPIVLNEPVIVTPKRNGFVVVEWGGTTEE